MQGPAADDPQAQAEFLAESQVQIERLEWITRDLLDLSRLESDRVWELEPLEVGAAIEQTLRTYRLNAEEKGVELAFEADPQLPPVQPDSGFAWIDGDDSLPHTVERKDVLRGVRKGRDPRSVLLPIDGPITPNKSRA